ncbi:MAG: hypothetical protein ACXVJW_06170 [Acidimicrobiia bacterium]
MPAEAMSRRAFLTVGGGALLLAACGGSSSSSAKKAGAKGLSAFRMEIEPYVSTTSQRFAFILVKNNGDFASGPPASLAIAPPRGSFGAAMPATLHTDGLPPGRGVYTVESTLPTPGNWRGKVTIEGHGEAELAFPVVANPDTPIVGSMARVLPTPTTAVPMGVDPLCTRTDDKNNPAPCSFHQTSLDQVVGKGKPVILMFATPARCQSRYCGPVLDQLIAVAPEYQGRITPIHVEIYKDLTSNDLVTATETWLGVSGEPWIFAMDGTGKVTGRLSGAFATDEIRTLIDHTLA